MLPGVCYLFAFNTENSMQLFLEYQLNEEGTFLTQSEQMCGATWMEGGLCDGDASVGCVEKGGFGLNLVDGSQYARYSIENINTVEFFIYTNHMKLIMRS